MSILKAGKPSNKAKALAQLNDSNDPFKRITLIAKTSLHKKLKQLSLDTDIPVVHLLEEFIKKGLEDYKKK